MTRPFLPVRGILAAIALSALAASVTTQAQQSGAPSAKIRTAPDRSKSSKAPRTPDGRPDLQGTWTYATLTPFERPSELADKQVLSDQEAAEFEKNELVRRDEDSREGHGTDADVARAYNQFWWDFGTKVVGDKRTSLIVDPSDGRLPPLTAEARQRSADRAEARRGRGAADSWEDRSLFERCIFGAGGPPMLPTAYNNNVQIVQSPAQVVVLHEMIHTPSIILMDGSPHVSPNIRQYAGDSRGHWEGETLVVDTTNFKTGIRGSSEDVRLTERFTRVGPDQLMYQFTVADPSTWARPWTAIVPMTRSEAPIYEYACHEGNYGLAGILRGARAQEEATQKVRPQR